MLNIDHAQIATGRTKNDDALPITSSGVFRGMGGKKGATDVETDDVPCRSGSSPGIGASSEEDAVKVDIALPCRYVSSPSRVPSLFPTAALFDGGLRVFISRISFRERRSTSEVVALAAYRQRGASAERRDAHRQARRRFYGSNDYDARDKVDPRQLSIFDTK